ncbi:unannotated protein [freshwater metagenome]|uniref:Unannotated protein n=1 Tax=freshwater metagenome TaxID=449393 RepID=A0A6J7NP49_9ZZZZ
MFPLPELQLPTQAPLSQQAVTCRPLRDVAAYKVAARQRRGLQEQARTRSSRDHPRGQHHLSEGRNRSRRSRVRFQGVGSRVLCLAQERVRVHRQSQKKQGQSSRYSTSQRVDRGGRRGASRYLPCAQRLRRLSFQSARRINGHALNRRGQLAQDAPRCTGYRSETPNPRSAGICHPEGT